VDHEVADVIARRSNKRFLVAFAKAAKALVVVG